MSERDGGPQGLLELLPRAARGPRRDGAFALWLTLRVAEDLLLQPPLAERASRRRLQALENRLSSLTLPPPLRRALAAVQRAARDTVSPEAADAVQRAARASRATAASLSR